MGVYHGTDIDRIPKGFRIKFRLVYTFSYHRPVKEVAVSPLVSLFKLFPNIYYLVSLLLRHREEVGVKGLEQAHVFLALAVVLIAYEAVGTAKLLDAARLVQHRDQLSTLGRGLILWRVVSNHVIVQLVTV